MTLYNWGYWDAFYIKVAIKVGDCNNAKGFGYLGHIEKRLGPKDWEIYKAGFDAGCKAWEQKPLLRKVAAKQYASDKKAEQRRARFKVIARSDEGSVW